MSEQPTFLITIDTEGDNLWQRPREIKTENARFLPRFQSLCERYGLKPTYLTNWEMANCKVFQEFGCDALQRGAAEIGMHLHAWNSPPTVPLTDDDYQHQPYLIEYPTDVMRDKIHALTDRLEETFDCNITSHRAGRWAINDIYARLLMERGYCVDCSVTPRVNWSWMKGKPDGTGGCDYMTFPDEPYFINLDRIREPGASTLLEVPMTIVPASVANLGNAMRRFTPNNHRSALRRLVNALMPDVAWLRPNGRNLKSMLRIVQEAVSRNCCHIEFMLHSSELMPGGSPRFSTRQSIERLYDHLEQLFAQASDLCRSATLAEFYEDSCELNPRFQAVTTKVGTN